MVLAVAHPRASTTSYLSSQFLADSRCNLHGTWIMPPLAVVPLSSFSPLSLLPLSRRSRLPRPATPPPPAPDPCSRGCSRLSAQLCPPRGIFWPLEFIELSSRKRFRRRRAEGIDAA